MNLSLQGTRTPATRRRHAVISATIGNALEWFDIIVFGFLAITISKLFFPAEDELTSLLMTVATFGVSFFVRPIGAVVLGIYADRAGSPRRALSLLNADDDRWHPVHRIRADIRLRRSAHGRRS